MSNLPVTSRLKAPMSRIGKPGATKSDAIAAPRASGLKPPSTSIETPQKSGLKQPLLKRSVGGLESQKTEKRSGLSSPNATGLTTPRSKQNGTQSKLKTGLVASRSTTNSDTSTPSSTPLKTLSPQESSGTNLKRPSSGSQSSLIKEPSAPVLTREKTQESIKDETTGIWFKVGDRVLVAGTKAGVIEYLGETKFAKGLWAGIKLDEAGGKNDGSVAGVKYFDCEPLHGVFSKPNRLHKINIVPKNSTSDHHANLDDSSTLKIGDQVIVSGTKMGVLRYLGPTEFAKGEWAGIELQEPLGKNDGAVAGTRYFTCEMKHGLFAPSSKVTKSKKKVLSKKPLNSTGPSLDSAAKLVFNRTGSVNSDITPASAAALLPGSPVEKPSGQSDEVTTSNESLHSGIKRTSSNAQQVAALQSALEEREREIHKMLMEKELEKAEKLKALEVNARSTDNSFNDQLLKEKDDIILALKDNLEKSKQENSIIQAKLDEEKKKYEDLQFMLEEEKITDDELKNHVKQDENKIKELSSESEEKNMKIIELQKELKEIRSDKISNEAKMLELRDQLAKSRTSFESLKQNMETAVDENYRDSHEVETSVENMKQELAQMKEMLDKREREINKLEGELNEQNEKVEAMDDYEVVKKERQHFNEELVRIKHEKIQIESNLRLKEDNLEALEKKYKDLMEENLVASNKKHEVSEASMVNLNTRISELESELMESKAKNSLLESNMALETDIAQQKTKQLENLLASTNKQLVESKDDVSKKEQLVKDLENKLNTQLTRQKEIEKEVESLGAADKNLTLMKEAHRSEVEALQSKVILLTENVNDLQSKQKTLVEDHQKELKLEEVRKNEEINKLRESMKRLESQCEELTQAVSCITAERNDAIQLCEEQDKQLEIIKTDYEKIASEKDSLSKERDELALKIVSLDSQINNLNAESSRKQGEHQQTLELEIAALKSKLDEAVKESMSSNNVINSLTEEKKKMENVVAAKANEISKLHHDQHKLHQRSQELEGQVSNLKKKMSDAAESAFNKTETLSNEILILKDDFEEAKSALKHKEEEVRIYKEQVEKMGSEDYPKSPMDGDILENASALMLRLHEAESKLAVVQSEKETAEEQVEFLNSIIVDLQNKNQKANETIALLEAGDEAILLHGLESESDDELMVKPRFTMRKFCDICDVFDEHETDECPLQESGEDTGGIQHHGDRNHERPYCGICEMFGHWSEDCNDEQTF